MKISVLFLMAVIISGVSLIGINQAFAFNCISTVAGTWNAPSTWSSCDGGVPDDFGDNADIQENADVQLNNDFVVGNLVVQEGGSLSLNAKLTAQILDVGTRGTLFINCNGELVLTEGGSNSGLLTNHGILKTGVGVVFNNERGTYLSSGIDMFEEPLIGNPIVPIASICLVGGTLVPIDSTALLLVGAQMTAAWMIPVIIAGIGIAIVIARKF